MNDILNIPYNILVLSLVVVIVGSFTVLSHADYISPKKQIESGVLYEDIMCRDGKVLTIRDNGSPACVRASTADKMNWSIIATEFKQEISSNNEIQINDKVENIKDENDLIEQNESINVNSTVDDDHTNNNDEQEFMVLDLGSDIPYVDDGRETHFGFQRSPAPENIYEKIIDNQEDNSIDPHGNMRIPAGFAHEKYSIVDGIGLYPADWMPTYIPDGYKLLFFENFYYEDTTGDAVLRINFVPNTFELTNQTTTNDVKWSEGFMVRIAYQTLPFDEIEDRIEYVKELKEPKPDYVGRWLDVQRDGKTVYAAETQTFYDDYNAVYAFSPNDNLIVGVSSHHHTLEEIEPIFNSVMN